MTPLAQRIVRELTLPTKARTYLAPPMFAEMVRDAHHFECSEIFEASKEFVQTGPAMTAALRSAFLPAPRTWIEFRGDAGERCGAILGDVEDPKLGRGIWIIAANEISALDVGLLQGERFLPASSVDADLIVSPFVALLAMINTPRVFGRRQHMPHAGLQRRLAAAQGMTGKFPLRAWTEIKLEVRLPRDESESGEHIAVLTGRKCLHFCRAHLRVQNGQIVFVSSCWRGDPSLGIKRSRYSLIPPRDGSPPKVFSP